MPSKSTEHPPYLTMIKEAILDADASDKKASRPYIKAFIEKKYKLDAEKDNHVKSTLNRSIESGVEKEEFSWSKGTGGSLKMTAAQKKEFVKGGGEPPVPVKKPASKSATVTKKTTTSTKSTTKAPAKKPASGVSKAKTTVTKKTTTAKPKSTSSTTKSATKPSTKKTTKKTTAVKKAPVKKSGATGVTAKKAAAAPAKKKVTPAKAKAKTKAKSSASTASRKKK